MPRDPIQQNVQPGKVVAVFFMQATLILMIGCQLSIPVKNKSGSVVDAVSDAELDFSNGRHQMLIHLSPKSDDFNTMQAWLETYSVKLEPYFPQSPSESSYCSSYNKTMRSRLKTLYGRDIYKEAWSQVDDTQYFGTED
jgi:hypothetical protein